MIDPKMYVLRRRVLLEKILHSSMTGGVLLLICAVVAVTAANVPALKWLHHFWDIDFGFMFGAFSFNMPVRQWVDVVLMAVFFFSVGLAIKR